MCIIKVLTKKHENNEVFNKCILIAKILICQSYDRDEEDVVIEGCLTMYDQLLKNERREDTLNLLACHLGRAVKLRKLIRDAGPTYIVEQVF